MNKSCEITLEDLLYTQYLVKNLKLKNNYRSKVLAADNITKTIGRGMEYAESRIYHPGDDVRHIDWRITARQSKTHTKLFHEEKGETNYVILDLSSSLYFGTKYYLKSVIACKVASLLAWLGFYENNSVGGIILNNQDSTFVKPKLTKNNIVFLLNAITRLHVPNQVYANSDIPITDQNLYSAIKKYESLLLKNSRIFIVSDFLNTNDLLASQIQRLKYNNLVTLIRIIDPIEEIDLAPGYYDISNGLSSSSIYIDKKNQNLFKDFFKDKLSTYNKLTTKLNINSIGVWSKPDWHHELICKL